MRERPGWAAFDQRFLTGRSAPSQGIQPVPPPELTKAQFLWSQYPSPEFLDLMAAPGQGQPRVHNHLEGNEVICTKCGLCETLSAFYLRCGRDPFGAIPLTFVVRDGNEDPQYTAWRRAFDVIEAESGQKMWLVKPGGWANRGCGIAIYDQQEAVRDHLNMEDPGKRRGSLESARLWVVQKYLEKPLLLNRRKFDIRAYCLVTQEPRGGVLRAYYFQGAYLRTTSAEYTTKTYDRMVHLNNDAVQSKGRDYGKYEPANKLSMEDFQRYLNEHHSEDGVSVQNHIVPQIKGLMADVIRAAAPRLNPRKLDHCFEVFGFDLMVDVGYRVWLIEVNCNPCIELCCPHLGKLIPRMIDDTLRLTLDTVYPRAAMLPPATSAYRTPGTGAAGTSWDELYCSSFEKEVPESSCPWLPRLPADAVEVDTSLLGRSLLSPQKSCGGQRRMGSMSPDV